MPLRKFDRHAFGAVEEHELARQVVLISSRFATAGKPFENQQISERALRATDSVFGTKRHQSAPSGTESPEKVPNYVLEAFTAAALATEPAALSSTETARCRPRRFARPCRQRIRGHAGGSGPAESQG
jgi:hypothetical protein